MTTKNGGSVKYVTMIGGSIAISVGAAWALIGSHGHDDLVGKDTYTREQEHLREDIKELRIDVKEILRRLPN